MAPSLQNIDHVHIVVTDRAAAEVWYRDVLGMTRVESLANWATGGGPLTVADASEKVHVALFERAERKTGLTVAFGASGEAFIAWRAHLADKLGQTLQPVDHEMSWSMYFTDPDGNPFEITTYDYAQVAAALQNA